MTIGAVEMQCFIVICVSADSLSHLGAYCPNLLTHLACSSLFLAAVVSLSIYIVLLCSEVSSFCDCLLNCDFQVPA